MRALNKTKNMQRYFLVMIKPLKRRIKRFGVQFALFGVLFAFIALALALYRLYIS